MGLLIILNYVLFFYSYDVFIYKATKTSLELMDKEGKIWYIHQTVSFSWAQDETTLSAPVHQVVLVPVLLRGR